MQLSWFVRSPEDALETRICEKYLASESKDPSSKHRIFQRILTRRLENDV